MPECANSGQSNLWGFPPPPAGAQQRSVSAKEEPPLWSANELQVEDVERVAGSSPSRRSDARVQEAGLVLNRGRAGRVLELARRRRDASAVPKYKPNVYAPYFLTSIGGSRRPLAQLCFCSNDQDGS